MFSQIEAAVDFICRLLRAHHKSKITEKQIKSFHECIETHLHKMYTGHWFPEKPRRGSGYRCIRINHDMDPAIATAATHAGLSRKLIRQLLPVELTLWIDPDIVAYRIGENGSICNVYEDCLERKSYTPESDNSNGEYDTTDGARSNSASPESPFTWTAASAPTFVPGRYAHPIMTSPQPDGMDPAEMRFYPDNNTVWVHGAGGARPVCSAEPDTQHKLPWILDAPISENFAQPYQSTKGRWRGFFTA